MKHYEMDELLNKSLHASCVGYENSFQRSLINIIELRGGEKRKINIGNKIYPQIVIINVGVIKLSFDNQNNFYFKEEEMLFLPPGHDISISSNMDAIVLLFKIDFSRQVCNKISLENLSLFVKPTTNIINPLKVNKTVRHWLNTEISIISMGLKCHQYLDSCVFQLIAILRAFYNQHELAAFFSPILKGSDLNFNSFIYLNKKLLPNVEVLAEMCNLAVPTFRTKFKKVFGITPYDYYEQDIRDEAIKDILFTTVPLKELVSKYNFKHYASFSKFIQRHFNKTPAELRKEQNFS